jgi:hypothetical protein
MGERDETIHELLDALRPLASQCKVKADHWIRMPNGGSYETDNGSEWCRDCASFMIRHLRKKDPKRRDEYILDGGWASEHDTPPMCCQCGAKLTASLLTYGGIYELEHFAENPPTPGNVDHAYEVSEMISAFLCVSDPQYFAAADEAIEIAHNLVAANSAEGRDHG